MARTFQKPASSFEPGRTLQTIRSLAGKMRSWIKSGHTRHVRANGKGVGSSQKVAPVRSRKSAQLFPVAGAAVQISPISLGFSGKIVIVFCRPRERIFPDLEEIRKLWLSSQPCHGRPVRNI